MVLGFGLKSLALAKKALYCLSLTPAHFPLVIFEIGSQVYTWESLDHISSGLGRNA
jgi:hypothetical protein